MEYGRKFRCKICGSLAIEERAGELICKACGTKRNGRKLHENLSLSERKKLMRMAALRVSDDRHTPVDVLDCRFVDFREREKDGEPLWHVEFIYKEKRYYLDFDEKGVFALLLPKNEKEIAWKKKQNGKFWRWFVGWTLIGGLLSGIIGNGLFWLGIFPIIILIIRSVKNDSKFYRQEKEEKKKNLVAFLEYNNLPPLVEGEIRE